MVCTKCGLVQPSTNIQHSAFMQHNSFTEEGKVNISQSNCALPGIAITIPIGGQSSITKRLALIQTRLNNSGSIKAGHLLSQCHIDEQINVLCSKYRWMRSMNEAIRQVAFQLCDIYHRTLTQQQRGKAFFGPDNRAAAFIHISLLRRWNKDNPLLTLKELVHVCGKTKRFTRFRVHDFIIILKYMKIHNLNVPKPHDENYDTEVNKILTANNETFIVSLPWDQKLGIKFYQARRGRIEVAHRVDAFNILAGDQVESIGQDTPTTWTENLLKETIQKYKNKHEKIQIKFSRKNRKRKRETHSQF